MVCSRSVVRLYAATPRSGPGLLCAAARFVSAMYATVWVRLGFAVLKKNLSLLEGLEFTSAASATTERDIYVPGAYTNFSFSFSV